MVMVVVSTNSRPTCILWRSETLSFAGREVLADGVELNAETQGQQELLGESVSAAADGIVPAVDQKVRGRSIGLS